MASDARMAVWAIVSLTRILTAVRMFAYNLGMHTRTWIMTIGIRELYTSDIILLMPSAPN